MKNNFINDANKKVIVELSASMEKILVNSENKKNSNINLNFCMNFKYFCCYKKKYLYKKKYQALSFLTNYLETKLDLINYFKTLDKFNKFKHLVLNKNQNICFDLIRKHNIFYKD